MEPEIGCVIKDDPTQSFYIKLKPSVIPAHWRNDPVLLSLNCYFRRREQYATHEKSVRIATPVEIIIREECGGYWLIDGGDGEALPLGTC